MSQFFYLLLLLACPLGMIFMMRSMGSMGRGRGDTEQVSPSDSPVIVTRAQDARIAELEREVAGLVEARGVVDKEVVGPRG